MTQPHYEQIRYEVRGATALITLDRPERLNAWTPRMASEQADAIERANSDPAVGAIVITGEGRGFCAGADMQDTFQSRIDGRDPGDDTARGQGGMPASLDWVELLRRSKPLVAAVNGAAVGIGVTMILPCDVIIASEKARFGMGFIKMGLVPELAEEIAANPSPQLRMIKQLLSENAAESDLKAVQQRESALLRSCWATPEHKEAVAAFIEKRPAKFR